MKAAVLHGLNDIRYEDVPTPETVGAGEVRVKVSCCGICRSDVPRVNAGTAHHVPLILGHEFSGTIDQIGSDVEGLNIGDRVVGIPLIPCMKCEDCRNGNFSLCKNYSFVGSRRDGGYAEYVVLPKSNVYKISSDIPFKQAALFETSTIALHGYMVGGFNSEDAKNGASANAKNVAVIGMGTVGLFAIQWARILGAERIVAIARSDERLALAKDLGATDRINTDKYSSQDELMAEALNLTEGRGFKFILDSAGQDATIKQALSILGNKGKIILIGTPGSDVSFDWKTWELINRREGKIIGSWMSYSSPFPGKEWEMTKEAMESGNLIHDDRLFHKIFPLSDVEAAFREFDETKVRGRILLEME